jgi:A/G-specific adenine glycosylase
VSLKTFPVRLLAWWDHHGRQDLPWQHPRSPYRVWVSEIMLQQTQVATVIPYFERFMARFPDLPALARAPLDEVLACWSGLGYYARAHNLHKAAQQVVAEHEGRLPESAEALAVLPGIGASTANAIVSQAHDVPAVVLDGNVRRVLARHAAIGGWAGNKGVARALWATAAERLPKDRAADYTQAIMDLGATVCVRDKPRCGQCPVAADCQARLAQAVHRYPAPRPKVDVREVRLHMLILTRPDGSVLLERRPESGIWGGLWSLPDSECLETLARDYRLDAPQLEALPRVRHRLTHRLLDIRPLRARSIRGAQTVQWAQNQDWFGCQEWPDLGLPKPVLGLLQRYVNGEYA